MKVKHIYFYAIFNLQDNQMKLLIIFLISLPLISNSGVTYSTTIPINNVPKWKIKKLILSGLKHLSNKQHHDYQSGQYECETPICCSEDDHDNGFKELADYYSQGIYGRSLKLNVRHFSMENQTFFTADIDVIQ